MKTSPASVVNAFNELATPELRHKAIWALIARFTSDELNELRTWSNSGVRDRDPICILPIELLFRIFRLVDLRTAFRCHRVSKDWRKFLSSYEIIRELFHSWFCCGSQGTLYSRNTPAPIASRMAAHFDAFRTGDPFAMTTILRAQNGHASTTAIAAYCGGLLAWSEESACTTNLLCLRTGRTKLWADEGRSKTHHIAVSELLVATCNHFGNVSVYNHLTDAKYTFKLSSANVRGFTLRRTTLAILLRGEILIWSLTTQKLRQIPLVSDSMKSINCARGSQETFGLQFAANGRELICSRAIMETVWEGSVTFTRVPSDGAPQETSEEHEVIYSYEPLFPETCQMIPSESRTFGTLMPSGQAMLIGYDECRKEPQFHDIGRAFRGWPPNGYYQKHVLYQGDYQFRSDNIIRTIFVKDLHEHRGQYDTEWKPTIMGGSALANTHISPSGAYDVLGDETFLVHMYPTHIMAYCFDQNSAGGYSWTKLRPSPISHKSKQEFAGLLPRSLSVIFRKSSS
ncbi:hypothetical protein MMC27_000208 [Xylographa pallens]|nr:hypothetical protein [Xylographa pallens]